MCEQKPCDPVWFSRRRKSYPVVDYEHLSDMWLSSLEISEARRSFAPSEIAPKSPSLCVSRSPTQYGFHAGTKAIRYRVNNSQSLI